MNSLHISRRTWLAGSLGATAALGLSSRWAPLLAGEASRGFLIGACDWSLGKDSNIEAFDVAKQVGLDGVQISLGRLKNDMHLRQPEMQKQYADTLEKTGLKIASLAIGEMNNVPLKNDERAAAWLMDSIDVCRAMKIEIVMPAFFGKGDLDMSNAAEIDTVVRRLKAAAEKAEKAGVIIALENYLSADDNLTIIERVGSPAVQVYYDVGNSTDKGRDVYKEIRQLGKLICQWHAKDGKHLLGQGRIDFKKVREAMDAIDYRGWIVLESAAPNGVMVDYAAQAKFLRDIFPRSA
jgi:sugar phosphate isomerase/epimerase